MQQRQQRRPNGARDAPSGADAGAQRMIGNPAEDGIAMTATSKKQQAEGEQTIRSTPASSVSEPATNDEFSDDSFFDALQPPSGASSVAVSSSDGGASRRTSGGDGDDDGASSDARNFVRDTVDLLGSNNRGAQGNKAAGGDIEIEEDGGGNKNGDGEEEDGRRDLNGSVILTDADYDRGYDEETDLLGLRSDSPPPLDLEEIEKALVKNMENARLY